MIFEIELPFNQGSHGSDLSLECRRQDAFRRSCALNDFHFVAHDRDVVGPVLEIDRLSGSVTPVSSEVRVDELLVITAPVPAVLTMTPIAAPVVTGFLSVKPSMATSQR